MDVKYVSYTWLPKNFNTSYFPDTEDIFTLPSRRQSTSSETKLKETTESTPTHLFQGWSIDNSEVQLQSTSTRSSTSSSTTLSTSKGSRYSRGNLRQEILNLLETQLGWKHGRDFNLGEAIRPRDAKHGSKNSYHYTGNAVDLTPRGNMTFDLMRVLMITNPAIRKFFQENGLGIIDESTEALRRQHNWNSTGNHYHIGPDSLAVSTWNDWSKLAGYAKQGGVLKAQLGIKFNSYNPVPEHASITTALNGLTSSIDIPIYDSTATVTQVRKQGDLKARAENIRHKFEGWKLDSMGTTPKLTQLTTSTKPDQITPESYEYSSTFLDRIIKLESSNNPKAVGPKTKSGDQAYGLYQIMWSNVKQYSKYTKEQFLNDPEEQRKVAEILAKSQWNQLTNSDKQLAAKKGLTRDQIQAAMWFSGVGGFRNFIRDTKDSSDGYKRVSQYIKDLT